MTRNKSIFTKNFCPYGPKFLVRFFIFLILLNTNELKLFPKIFKKFA